LECKAAILSKFFNSILDSTFSISRELSEFSSIEGRAENEFPDILQFLVDCVGEISFGITGAASMSDLDRSAYREIKSIFCI
jgi:hypothetical protein